MGPFTLPRSQKYGGLLKLPSELRLLIYEELFPPTKIDIHAIERGLYIDERGNEGTTSALRCCQTMYEEARPVLHASFDVHLLFRFAGRMATPWFFYQDYEQSQQFKSLSSFSALSLHINLVDEDPRYIHEENENLFPERLSRALYELSNLITQINATPNIKKIHI